MSEFLLEIGTEEIPDWMIEGALEDLERRFRQKLSESGIDEGASLRTAATPRRLTLVAENLASRQADRRERLSGPPRNLAFDSDGKPTKAAEGFARRAGVAVEELQTGDDGKVYVERIVGGRLTAEILAEALPDVVLTIYFPKTMYWTGRQGPRWIRPIRWLAALLDGEVVSFEIAGVPSGARTHGHRRLGRRDLEVRDWASYERALAENYVLLDAAERRRRIEAGCAESVNGGRLEVRSNPKLLHTLTYLTEYPTVIAGEFEPAFLELPDEVLETVMLVHQKYFAVDDRATGRLSNRFVAVANLDGDPDGVIRQGHERVLRARFNDARFFWRSDQRKKLAERVEDLKAVTFQAELGSYAEKATRMRSLVGRLADQAAAPAEVREAADRAALLAKCDLTTEMVGEFPELQGVIGGLYAAHQGESQAVADAVYDHYKPAGAGDGIPRNAAGQLVALADKLDTLGGMFRLGQIPTGSRDPFALRRAAYGVVLIVIQGGWNSSLRELVRLAEAGEHDAELTDFLIERLRYYLAEERSFRYDEINAVLSADADRPLDVAARVEAIAEVRPTPDFEPLAVSFKRIENILKKAGGVAIHAARDLDVSRFEDAPERELYEAYQRLRPEAEALREKAEYVPALSKIASLRPTVDRFFDHVLVMAPDEAVRDNRLALLARLLEEFSTIANFAEIVSREPQ